MVKICDGKQISRCSDCDDSIHVKRRGKYLCMSSAWDHDEYSDMVFFDFEAVEGFPDWCPLPDLGERK